MIHLDDNQFDLIEAARRHISGDGTHWSDWVLSQADDQRGGLFLHAVDGPQLKRLYRITADVLEVQDQYSTEWTRVTDIYQLSDLSGGDGPDG